MADRLQLRIVTPERETLVIEVDEVVLPSVEGSMGVLAGHAPLLAQLRIGEVSYRVGSERRYLAVSGGFAEVLRSEVSVLAETCEPAEAIDVERARRAKQTAEEALQSGASDQALAQAEVRLRRALNRLDIHGRARGMMS
jgi:F-type H+-transporting ATPase subunit epsilon